MEEALSFFRAFEVWIYVLLGLGGLIYARKFVLAWQELRGAVFGLERESAQARLNQAASMLVLLLTMAVTEFVLVSFVAPAVPGAIPLLTPTLDLLATPTITLPATTPQPSEQGASDGLAVPQLTTQGGCIPRQIEIIFPENGQEVSGVIEVVGTVDIPTFDFYKFEIKRPDDAIWLTIQAGSDIVRNGRLGEWDTTRLTPGEYQLGLVVVDDQAQAFAPCVVQLFVARPPDETPGP
ncbi:MAG: hypothetical protein JXA78_01480 [Anaerolineales bacterium]|nr:hypothetical protein [Anaerolineales bacterium]